LPSDYRQYLLGCEYIEAENGSKNTRKYFLKIPESNGEKVLTSAWLEIPENFPELGVINVFLPKKYVLKIPHIESSGRLCIKGDPGPYSGAHACERIDATIHSFYTNFLDPLLKGDLEDEFLKEAMNYWYIHCENYRTNSSPIRRIYTTDQEQKESNIFNGRLIEGKKIAIYGQDSQLLSRYLETLGSNRSFSNIKVMEVPISFPFTPNNWPKSKADIVRLLNSRVGNFKAKQFLASQGRRKKDIHRLVIFRAPGCSFGYLLPGGPPIIVHRERSTMSFPSDKLIPLEVERIDPSWTTGRDQAPEYSGRQSTHVLLIGTGALGSAVAEQLAKSGIGSLTLVDAENLSSANLSRHTLGAESLGQSKAKRLADKIKTSWPTCSVKGYSQSITAWLKNNSIKDVDVIADITGESNVRALIDNARRNNSTKLMIAWMEPFVAAAHACAMNAGSFWINSDYDQLEDQNAVIWPDDILLNEPSCSSTFQSYTSSAASYAVALATEATLDLIDGKIKLPIVRHWIRGQVYLDSCRPGLIYKDWAKFSKDFDGIVAETKYD